MKPLIVYWVLGCLVIGPALAGRLNDCPKDDVEFSQVVRAVAVWPALLIAAIGLKRADKSCKAAPSSGSEG